MKATGIAARAVLLSTILFLAVNGGGLLGPGHAVAAPLPLENHAALAAVPPAEPPLAQKPRTLAPASPRKGFIPPPLHYSQLNVDRLPAGVTAQDLPSRWDWREHGGVTPPKAQGACGSCYAFGAIGNIESRILVDGGAAYDFSENHAKECSWEARTHWADHGDPWGSCEGGNYVMLANLFSQTGTVLESCNPYVDQDTLCGTSCPYQVTVLDWRLISGRAIPDTNVLKGYIKTYGPVESSMYAGQSDPWDSEFGQYDGSYTLHYDVGSGSTNHSVLIVGWDDDRYHDGGEGAWIAKNSWGTDWGDGGYFYIAYGSARMGSFAGYTHAYQPYDPTGVLLHYDEAGGWWATWPADGESGSTTAWGLCAFDSGRDTEVTRVEFWTTDATTDVDIYVYDGFDGTTPGDLLFSQLDLAYAEMGYHSVPVDPPLPLAKGEEVVAVVKFTNQSSRSPIAVDPRGAVEQQRTYASITGADGTWIDMSTEDTPADVAIRLRTSGGIVPTPTETLVPTIGPTRTPTPTMWGTPADLPTPTSTATGTATPTATATRTATPTTSPTATSTEAPTQTSTATPTLTPSPTTPSESCLIESAHPYANGYDHTWTLHNPDPNATASRVHFSRLETERGWDYVIIRDSAGNERQRIHGSYPSGLWSHAVPGRTIQVQLLSGVANTAWGFCADRIASTEMPICEVESPHPYPDFYDETWTITNPDPSATASRIHFSLLETEARYDYVIVRDSSGTEIQRIHGSYPSGLWSYAVPGRTIQIQLLSDESNSGWGFCVDQIASTEMPICLAESPHPYPNDYDDTWTITNPDPSATASRIHFSMLDTEPNYDYVVIKDSAGTEIQRIHGAFHSGLWSAEVPGRIVRVLLTSDYSNVAWGFCVDQVLTVFEHQVYLPLVLR